MSDKLKQYLRKYASPAYKINSEVQSCSYAVVVPAIAEYDKIKTFLKSFTHLDNTYFSDTLLLFVINHSASSPADVREDNYKTLRLIKEITIPGLNLGYIDAASEGNELPDKDAGVGLARKIGMDVALSLFSDPVRGVLICTDADCTFEKNYLTEIVKAFQNKQFHAAAVKFRHSMDDEQTTDGVINYEIFLRYYVLGLKYAASPYAFHTIGSSMACTAEAYMNVEGMNKRKAAEDFYFLEKLAKKYSVSKINGTVVYPSPRRSWRVPFGTGQRMNRFLSNVQDEYVLYHPDCFKVLAEWHELFYKSPVLNSFEYLDSAKKINNELFVFLSGQGFEQDWENIVKNSRNPYTLDKQKRFWFDGFRTLKLIHHLRDKAFGNIPMFKALDLLLLMMNENFEFSTPEVIPGREIQLNYLEKLREIDN